MTTRFHIIRFVSLLAAACLISGCVFADRFKQSLSPPPVVTDKRGDSWGPDKQSPLLADILYFAGQIHHMPAEERKKNATALRNMLKTSPFPKDRLVLALLALYVEEDTVPTAEALESLENLSPAEIGDDPKLLGLINVLRQSLRRIEQEKEQGKESARQLKQAIEKKDKLEVELTAEKKKSEEMAQKLQKLLEIEKIMEQRKE